jgi:outer membrane protein insertion porin family
MDPWFGGKRPNTLSVSAYYSKQSGVNNDFLSNSMSSYGMGSYYGTGSYGYGYGYDPYNSYELAYDPNQSLEMIALSAGYGKRLEWPDDYFQFMATLSYQVYMLNNWEYYRYYGMGFTTGNSHNINLELLLQRSSVDNPIYTRRGSQFSVSLSATPPYSLVDGKDYASMTPEDRSKLLEYHKWKIKAKVFTPLLPLTVKRTPVLMSRVEYGFLGHYNEYKISPFETFYMGGSGMTGYSGMMATETIALRGYEDGSISSSGYAYARLGMELRYPFLLEPSSTIYGLAFVEAGNAWSDLKMFNPLALKRSAGVGVRIFLPMIGLMGIDWAYGFDTPDYSTKRGGSQFHFIIGQEF